ncbi:MAG: hypothetical protein EZS28_049442, partial [Streblomastix strix]
MPSNHFDIWTILFPLGTNIFGATVVTTKKLQFQQLVLGIDGTIHPFRKPCIQVKMLNISELGSLIAFGASFAMTLAPPSLLEVLMCYRIIFNPIWEFICMIRTFTVDQYGCVLIALIGAVIASCSSFLSKSAPSENPIIGSLLMFVAQMCSSFQYVIEEKLMLKQHYDPTLALGIEGIIGSVLMIILLIIFQLIPGKSVGSVENTLDS